MQFCAVRLQDIKAFSVPDNLVDEVVGVLGSKHGQSGPCRHALLKSDHLGVGGEDGRLVHVLNRDGDSCRGLEGGLNAARQMGLVGHHYSQHEGTIHLKIHRLGKGNHGETEFGWRVGHRK